VKYLGANTAQEKEFALNAMTIKILISCHLAQSLVPLMIKLPLGLNCQFMTTLQKMEVKNVSMTVQIQDQFIQTPLTMDRKLQDVYTVEPNV